MRGSGRCSLCEFVSLRFRWYVRVLRANGTMIVPKPPIIRTAGLSCEPPPLPVVGTSPMAISSYSNALLYTRRIFYRRLVPMYLQGAQGQSGAKQRSLASHGKDRQEEGPVVFGKGRIDNDLSPSQRAEEERNKVSSLSHATLPPPKMQLHDSPCIVHRASASSTSNSKKPACNRRKLTARTRWRGSEPYLALSPQSLVPRAAGRSDRGG